MSVATAAFGARTVRRRLIAAGLVFSMLGATACTTTNTARFNNPSDACNAYRQPVIALQETEQQKRVESALIGAAAAGLLTALILGAAGDKHWWQKGLAAGIVGGLAGYSLQYFREKEQKANTREQLLASVNADAGQETRHLNKTAQAIQRLRDCRSGEIRTLKADVVKKRAAPQAARSRLAGIKARVAEDNELISIALDGADKRVTSYVDATSAASEVEQDIIVTASTKPNQKVAGRTNRQKVNKVKKTSPDVFKAVKKQEANKATNKELEEAQDLELAAIDAYLGVG